jgi:uncharacterized membrane protein
MSYLKRYVRATSIAEFLRYAFTPSFGLIGYTAFFALAMVLSFIQFRRYKNHYNKVFDK